MIKKYVKTLNKPNNIINNFTNTPLSLSTWVLKMV